MEGGAKRVHRPPPGRTVLNEGVTDVKEYLNLNAVMTGLVHYSGTEDTASNT